MPNWSKEQLEAITCPNMNVLVSASAGSGKTAVLTERVFRIIKGGAKLNELLVLTFTNLAAQEMRNRIRQKLLDDGLTELASSVDAVSIQTYDAFALTIVQKYQYLLGINKEIKIVDSSLIELEIRKTLEKILKKHYLNNEDDVNKLVYDFCRKGDQNLKDFIIEVYYHANLKLDKKEYLNGFIAKYYNKAKIKSIVEKDYQDFKNDLTKYYSEIKSIDNISFVDKFLACLDKLIATTNLKDLVSTTTTKGFFPQARGLDNDEKNLVDRIKDNIKKYIGRANYDSLDDIVERLYNNKDYASTILRIVKELDTEIETFKSKYSVYTFLDIFKMAMNIVTNSEVNAKLKKQFKYIIIDEYQDTSDLQEELISMIANNNVFAVGDVKQSIYKFRNANPDLFIKKFNDYSKGINGRLITLPDNFRSREEVINGVNDIFKVVMSKENTGLDYAKEHMMLFGNKKYLVHPTGLNHNFETIKYDCPENITSSEYEAILIANDIISKFNAKIQVMEDGALRDIKFSDFAILSYAKTDFKIYQKVFNDYGIPLYANYQQNLNDNDYTLVFKNIIKLISFVKNEDYGVNFKHSLVSLMRSFIFEERDETIEDMISKNNYEDYSEYKLIVDLYNFSKDHSLEDLTNEIIKKFDLYQKFIEVGDISNNIELTNFFINIAKEMDEMNYGIEDYARYYDELDKYEIDQEFDSVKPSIDSVQLMSIHASKGLQFKYVYFVKLARNVKSSNSTTFILDDDYGMDFKNLHYQNIESYFANAIKSKNVANDINEQIRVFYVALTRTEEKGIFLVSNAKSKYPDSFEKVNSYLSMYLFSGVSLGNIEVSIDKNARPNIVSATEEGKKLEINDGYIFSKDTHKKHHISKSKSEDADNEALKLGTKYHYYLELVDFTSKDTSFIKNEKDRFFIDKFLKSEVFKDTSKAKICHEYAFYDEEEDLNGVIDLLIIYDDHIDIVDFKLSKVSDEAYNKQVTSYKNYISKMVPNKPVHCYVLGIMSNKLNKVC